MGGSLALAGVAVGAAAQWLMGWTSFKRDKSWAIREERRAHIEELWEALEQTQDSLDQSAAKAALALRGNAPVRDIASDKIPWARMRLLVSLYLPEFSMSLIGVKLKGDRVGEFLAQAVIAREPRPVSELISNLRTASEELDMAITTLKSEMIDQARDISVRKSIAAGE